jgi:hypothetical protein
MWWIPLWIIAIVLVLITRPDPVLVELKKRYTAFIRSLPPKFDKIKQQGIITATYRKGQIGSNVNKGGEIYVCLESSVNDAFHVLLHELAHSSVKEYDHSQHFWETFKELKELAINGGYYTPVGTKNYCGKQISDG